MRGSGSSISAFIQFLFSVFKMKFCLVEGFQYILIFVLFWLKFENRSCGWTFRGVENCPGYVVKWTEEVAEENGQNDLMSSLMLLKKYTPKIVSLCG